MTQPLLFIDSNILLDFYRLRGRDTDLSVLKHIDDHLDRFITTSQVEMEFKKNRPGVILDTYEHLKGADATQGQLPAFLAAAKQSTALERNRKEMARHIRTLRARVGRVFESPTRADRVYQTAQRLFRARSPYNLTRDTRERRAIRTMALRRFLLGYPPRKSDDTSIGDAVNWEWIVHCARQSGADIVVVSRDKDFGVRFDNRLHLNDWLLQEFRDRVSKRRQISLVGRLTEGLKAASIRVTRREEQIEDRLIKARRASADTPRDERYEKLLRAAFEALGGAGARSVSLTEDDADESQTFDWADQE
jgi:hypothetical protein